MTRLVGRVTPSLAAGGGSIVRLFYLADDAIDVPASTNKMCSWLAAATSGRDGTSIAHSTPRRLKAHSMDGRAPAEVTVQASTRSPNACSERGTQAS